MFDTTVIESRKDSIGFRIGLNSKPTPLVAGVQWLGRSPIGTKMAPNRRVGAPAVLTVAVSAGTIASSSGSARVAPIPRSIVRRDKALFVTIMPDLRGLWPMAEGRRKERSGDQL